MMERVRERVGKPVVQVQWQLKEAQEMVLGAGQRGDMALGIATGHALQCKCLYLRCRAIAF